MQFLATSATATATAVASSLVYAQPAHIQAQHVNAPQAGTEVTQMISRPKLPVEIVINLKYLFDHDLLIRDDFYSEATVKKMFNAEEVTVLHGNDDAGRRVSVTSNTFDSIFPRRKASATFGGSVAGASLSARKTTLNSGSTTAFLHFIIGTGGPDFQFARTTFGDKFVLVPPRPRPFNAGPLPVTSIHGNETWKLNLNTNDLERAITLGFDEASQLSNILIEIKQN